MVRDVPVSALASAITAVTAGTGGAPFKGRGGSRDSLGQPGTVPNGPVAERAFTSPSARAAEAATREARERAEAETRARSGRLPNFGLPARASARHAAPFIAQLIGQEGVLEVSSRSLEARRREQDRIERQRRLVEDDSLFGSLAPDRTAEPDAAADAYRRTDEVVRTFAADRYSLRPDDDGLFIAARIVDITV